MVWPGLCPKALPTTIVRMHEIVHFDDALSAYDIAMVTTYLKKKWGL